MKNPWEEKQSWEEEFEWDSNESRVGAFFHFIWRAFQIFVVMCFFVGLAVSQQCQNQVQEACEIVRLCD